MSNHHSSFKLDLAPGYVSRKVRNQYAPRPRIARTARGYPVGIVGLLLAAFVVGFTMACAFGYGG